MVDAIALPPSFRIRRGSGLDRALLVKFTQRTYRELYPQAALGQLAITVEQYFSGETPLWWVDCIGDEPPSPVGCLWLGNSVDQVGGDRHAHIFLLYVVPQYRRLGIGSVLMHQAEQWARERGDRQIGLQVFASNRAAINLYEKLGFQTQSLGMVKPLI